MSKILAPLALVAALVAVVIAGPASAQRADSAATTRATLAVHKGKLGRYIVDGRGFTLYLFEKDTGTKSHCNGTCAKVWAPLLTRGKARAGAGVKASKIGTTRRKDGTLQVTYGGHPLYHYDDDHKPGMTEGQDSNEFGAKWYVVAPSGKKIDPS